MMQAAKLQLELFWIALGFFSRIPIPANLDFSSQKLNQACRYFPLVGWLVAAICSGVFYIAQQYLSTDIAILFAMLAGVLLTGAFHEDGLIDSADGMGGGWTTAQKLLIMKDSRVGSYGAIAMWFVLTLKFALLSSYASDYVNSDATGFNNSYNVMFAFMLAHPLSRAVSTLMMFISPYVRDTDDAKAKPVAEPKQKIDLYISLLLGCVGLFFATEYILPMLIALIGFVVCFRYFAHKQVGGITGDVLGAAQQLSELVIYVVLIVAAPV